MIIASDDEVSLYRVWPDGTVQDADETPHKWMSDDYVLVQGGCEADASLIGNPPSVKLNTDNTVAVATDVFWNEDMTTCPRGVKVQLLGAGGVAMYALWDGKNPFFKKWAPLPRNKGPS